MQKITPFLWFNDQAEEAANFYTSIFKNSRITNVSRYTEAGPLPEGTVLTMSFELEGEEFVALNGGPEYQFSPAISFQVTCESQQEVDHYWSRLLEGGGEEVQCGWLTDRFGLSWQITPRVLMDLVQDPDRDKANRVMQAMFQMKKIDIAGIERAAAGG
jgi:predicted 3-demethylubiquinone-9 3-methyltransferase (glyoxalase superfamily)